MPKAKSTKQPNETMDTKVPCFRCKKLKSMTGSLMLSRNKLSAWVCHDCRGMVKVCECVCHGHLHTVHFMPCCDQGFVVL